METEKADALYPNDTSVCSWAVTCRFQSYVWTTTTQPCPATCQNAPFWTPLFLCLPTFTLLPESGTCRSSIYLCALFLFLLYYLEISYCQSEKLNVDVEFNGTCRKMNSGEIQLMSHDWMISIMNKDEGITELAQL